MTFFDTASSSAAPSAAPSGTSSRQALRRRHLLALAATAALPLGARAQAWPAKPVKITVAYPPGGVADTLARVLAEKLAPVLGQSVVVDNKAGASGTIGMDAVAKAAPDGYSFGFAAISPLVLSPHLGKVPFDPARDIVPVVSVIASPVLLLGTQALSARDFKALIAAAKAQPGAIRWATSGPASLGHIVLEQVKAGTGADITHIPYKGGGSRSPTRCRASSRCWSVNASSGHHGPHQGRQAMHPLAVAARSAGGAARTCPRWPSWAARGQPGLVFACSRRPARPRPWSTA